MRIVFALFKGTNIWSQWNFSHTKTAQLSWYAQNFIVIILTGEKIYKQMYFDWKRFDQIPPVGLTESYKSNTVI